MSPYARRRCLKIVAPLTPNREEEIIGGLKNALERGETLAKAKQSFLNAGYKPAEIDGAVRKMPATNTQIKKPITTPAETKIPAAQKPTANNQSPPRTTSIMPGQKKHLSKKFIIILVSIAALILIGAALLGIFWSTISGWFG